MAVSEQPQQARQRDSRPRKALTIGAVCKILQSEFDDVSISKIRYLEDQKLLTPRRTAGGYRLYSQSDVERLRTILRLQRDEFLPLRVIRQELAAGGDFVPAGGSSDKRPSGGAVRRAILVNTSRAYLTLEEVIEETGAREELIAELENFGIVAARETRGQDGLRRDRPRSRARRQRALAGRRRRPQPARLPLLGRPRGEPAGSAARPLAALAQSRSPQGGAGEPGEPGGDGQPPQAPACWSGTYVASPATDGASGAPGHSPPHDRRTAPRGLGAVSDPYSLPRWWPRTMRVESVEGEGADAQWTKVLGHRRGAWRASRLSLPRAASRASASAGSR